MNHTVGRLLARRADTRENIEAVYFAKTTVLCRQVAAACQSEMPTRAGFRASGKKAQGRHVNVGRQMAEMPCPVMITTFKYNICMQAGICWDLVPTYKKRLVWTCMQRMEGPATFDAVQPALARPTARHVVPLSGRFVSVPEGFSLRACVLKIPRTAVRKRGKKQKHRG
ncbi:hypothetical protein MAPG_04136 [Magnaporthiopsis poae ATCC 64411]|uniref:Uncharacterized protein n=1 Tax=Magnaporthiopsis poae (strain ATCC 64411 / 73-15) TaxID=644358 RepID=A0A0C4DVX3_MAGP6|nr:hypothetical protein MAPG_04136 [Magnaporthiopsis poae ATCC 64411]